MSSSQLPDQQAIFEEETRHWYERLFFLLVVGVVFISIPFMLTYSTIKNRRNNHVQ
jgi:hypothetical protein